MDKLKSTMAKQIAQAAIAFEQRRTGNHMPRSVTMVLSEGTLVITLHDALSPAEKALAQSPAGAAQMQEIHRQLFSNSSNSLRQEISRITGMEVREATAAIEPASGAVVQAFTTGTVVQVFRLAGSAPTEVWSGSTPGNLDVKSEQQHDRHDEAPNQAISAHDHNRDQTRCAPTGLIRICVSRGTGPGSVKPRERNGERLPARKRDAMNSEAQHDVVRLAAAANPFQAHIWQQALEQEGIRCQVLGDYLDAGIGDIPGFSAEVWVETADLARAEAILRQHQNHSEEAAQPEENA